MNNILNSVILLLLVFTACSSSKKTSAENDIKFSSEILEAHPWLADPPKENAENIYAFAESTRSSEYVANQMVDSNIIYELASIIAQKIGSFTSLTTIILPKNEKELINFTISTIENYEVEILYEYKILRKTCSKIEVAEYKRKQRSCAVLWEYPKSAIVTSLENKFSQNEEYYAKLKGYNYFEKLAEALTEG